MRILIIGSGFIGYNLAVGFLESEYHVAIVDKHKLGKVDSYTFYHQPLDDKIDKVFETEKPDVVYFLTDGKLSDANDFLFPNNLSTNLQNFINTLNVCVKNKVKKVIICSLYSISHNDCTTCLSRAKYQLPMLQSSQINTFIEELILQHYKMQHKLDFVSLRTSDVYGFRKLSHWSPNLVDKILRAVKRNRILRLNYHPQDKISLLYIGDVVTALILSLREGISGIYNVHGDNHDLNELVNQVSKHIKLKVKFGKDVKTLKAKENFRTNTLTDYGWKPIVSLPAGIQVVLRQVLSKKDLFL